MQAFNWTELATAAARKSHALGMTAAKTAAALKRAFGASVSRNAVIGKWFRMGLLGRAASRSRRPTSAEPKSPAARRSRTKYAPYPDALLHPPARRKQLVDLGPGDCRWPVGDPKKADFFFCAAPQLTGRSYCRRHYLVATSPRLALR
jgi:GcrA cell cycle regulator